MSSAAAIDESIFGGRNINTIISILKDKERKWSHKKTFWVTYPSIWGKYTDDKKRKTIQFFEQLTEEERKDVFLKATAIVNAHNAAETERAQQTNKDDKGRILHMRKDPALTTLWTATATPLDRAQLDARSSGLENYVDPWNLLAVEFNDYLRNKYQNPCVLYIGDEKTNVNPLGEFSFLFDRCHDIDPTNATRPIRSGAWFKEKWSDLRTELTRTYANFTKSGNQDLEDPILQWGSFCATDDVIAYSVMLFSLDKKTGDYAKLGKLLEPQMQRDTGLIDDDEVSSIATEDEEIVLRQLDDPSQLEYVSTAAKRKYSETTGAM